MVLCFIGFACFSIYESMIDCLGCSYGRGDWISMPDLPMSITCSFDHALNLLALIEVIVTRSFLCKVWGFEIRTGAVDLKMLFTRIIYVLLCYPCSELKHMHSIGCSRLVTSALSVICL